MIVYRDGKRKINTTAFLAEVRQQTDPLRALMDFGEFEAAFADALPRDWCEEHAAMRRASAVAARALVRGERLFGFGAWPDFSRLRLPLELEVSKPEGYAYYAVYPEMYVLAARKFARDRTPGRAVIIGIRSIGTSLSAAVEAALEEAGWQTRSFTVRPQGHPFDRALPVSDRLAAEWRTWPDAEFLLVDEGPGLSGSSFAAAARAVEQHTGAAPHRIALFPAYDTDGSAFRNPAAADQWRKHRRYVSRIEDVHPPLSCYTDISAGKWREWLLPDRDSWPAVQPQHERRKFIASPSLMRFAGLGRYGEEALELARVLHDGGWGSDVRQIEFGGFLDMPLEVGAVVTSNATPELVAHAAGYLAFRERMFPRSRSESIDSLESMIRFNSEQAMGAAPPESWFTSLRSELADRPATAIDGRMLAHEWIRTEKGYLKTDALDHHADHFYPGDADIAWDLAATSVEFDLDEQGRRFLAERFRASGGEPVTDAVLDFYETAWTAFRLGYVSMAAESAGPDERLRFEKLKFRYSSKMKALLGQQLSTGNTA